MAVRFIPDDSPGVEDDPPAMLRCSECEWSKLVRLSLVTASLRGHYGYKHPERRLPDRRDARRAAGLES